MKKVKYGVLLLVLIGIVFVGCQKDNPQPNRSQIAKVNKPFHSDENAKTKSNDDGPVARYNEAVGECIADQHPNCWPPVDIRPNALHVINDIGHASDNGNNDDVISIINTNYDLLCNYIPEADLYSITSGDATVRINDSTNKNGICYFIISKQGKIYHVFQFTE